MIKVGILGAATRPAGEIIRILTNHPDVELRCTYAPGHTGIAVSKVHHGLIGEDSLTFTETVATGRLDVVIICEVSELTDKIALHPELYPDLRVIDLTGKYRRMPEAELRYGLSEINRKELVRGATRAYVPEPIEALALIALFPFANSLMLNDDISIEASGNVAVSTATADDIAVILSKIQQSFNSRVLLTANPSAEEKSLGRGMRLRISFPCMLSATDASQLYENIYDDHNFTFLLDHPASLAEVEGTNKCIIHLSKPDEQTMLIDAVADATLTGGAGDAVHVLNLLFGLHELTGLSLKAINY